MPPTWAVPMPDHEDIRWFTPEEFEALLGVTGKALDAALAYDRNASDIATEMHDLMAALHAARAAYDVANERREAERSAEIAILERRLGPELWD